MIGRMDAMEVVDPLNILDALNFKHSSWREVKQSTIQNCFAIAGNTVAVNFPLVDSHSNDLIITYCSMKQITPVDFDQFVTVRE